ncbi:hypothetical protein B0H19DRAFT_1085120 [Mycena capillaripes]|nr:hypothetical protein B0H19DRAFT_1085120 [Mycena capillaripes]
MSSGGTPSKSCMNCRRRKLVRSNAQKCDGKRPKCEKFTTLPRAFEPNSTEQLLSFLCGVSQAELEPLMRNFLKHGCQFGFLLNINRFQEAATGRSGPSSYSERDVLRSASSSLPPPRDAIEEAERINNCWTTADGSPSNISHTGPDLRIHTPWPLDVDAPISHNQTLPFSSIGTVANFLASRPDSAVSMAAMYAKAAILFEHAAHLASHYRPSADVNTEQLNQFFHSFNSIDTLIERFKTTLPAVHLHPTRQMLLIYTLVHVATIQLHNPFIVNIEPSLVRVLDSARVVVTALAQLPVNEFMFINPIRGTLLMATSRFKRHRARNGPVRPEKTVLTNAIDTVRPAMNIFAARCSLMGSQLRTMRLPHHGL